MLAQENVLDQDDQKNLVTILSALAGRSPGLEPQAFFNYLLRQARLPEPWVQQWTGVWKGNIPYDAWELVRWALGQGTNPQDTRYTVLGSLLQQVLQSIGDEDRKTVAQLIVKYQLYKDHSELRELKNSFQLGEDDEQRYIEPNKSDVSSIVMQNYILESSLVENVQRFVRPLQLRFLFATSSPDLGDQADINVNSEAAHLRDTISKVLIQSRLSSKFDVEIYKFIDKNHIECVDSTNNRQGLRCLPKLDELDCIIMIVWHNLGDQQAGVWSLEWLYQEAQNILQSSTTRLQLFLYRRTPDPTVSRGDQDRESKLHQYDSVTEFFRNVQDDVPYQYQQFEDKFNIDLRRWLYDVIKKAEPVLSGGKSEAPRDRQSFDNPFRGLPHYDTKHHALFFGRYKEGHELSNKLAQNFGFLAVVGPSGSGKSSLVRAGLLHRLEIEAIPGSNKWKIVDIVLSQNVGPFTKLARALLRVLPMSSDFHDLSEDELSDRLCNDFTTINAVATEVLKDEPATARLVLFIDQFEELFTLVKKEDQQNTFIDFLVTTAKSPRQQVILTMRSEYYHHCLGHEGLKELFEKGVYPLATPSQEMLFIIITRPVLFSGLRFEDQDLPRLILREAGSSSGALPLISYTLNQLTEKCKSDGVLTRKAYKDLGGVRGVIQSQAEEAVKELKTDQDFERNFNELFRQLVTGGEDGQPTKRPANSKKLSDGAKHLARVLVEKRLLQSSEKDDEPVIEIAHEALLSNWDLLGKWVNDRRSALVLMHLVKSTAKEWQEARCEAAKKCEIEAKNIAYEYLKIDYEFLWTHERLGTVHDAMDMLGIELTELSDLEQQFIRPEHDRLCEELHIETVSHQRRAWIGDRLAILGDQRPGVGLNKDDLPDIVWCKIPAGQVKLQDVEEAFDVKEFYIAKYPVTLAQFNVFTQREIYFDNAWWQALDIKPEQHKAISQNPDAMTNRPAEWVSWYQAIAFCCWLSHAVGYQVYLPTEWEWQQAATGGRPNYQYPWGTEWNAMYSSNKEGLAQLVAVGLYPLGTSPAGVMDMSGNVYEWCMNKFERIHDIGLNGNEKRTTRGGAWFTFLKDIEVCKALNVFHRLADHSRGYNERGDRIRAGFRLACNAPPVGSRIEINNGEFGSAMQVML